MGSRGASRRETRLTRYLLDTAVLVAHLRDDDQIRRLILGLLKDGHSLAACCVNIAEVERGIWSRERLRAEELVRRLEYLPTTTEAAKRAGSYQAALARRGKTLHLADALIAGTARAHGAVLVTHNVDDFSMGDLRVLHPSAL
jgi:predicted nucleic acid-binding protein